MSAVKHPKYITDGSRMLEIYDVSTTGLFGRDVVTGEVKFVENQLLRTTDWDGEEGAGGRWWPVKS